MAAGGSERKEYSFYVVRSLLPKMAVQQLALHRESLRDSIHQPVQGRKCAGV